MDSFLIRFFSGRQPLVCLLLAACAIWLAVVSEAFAQDQFIPAQPALPANPPASTVVPAIPATGSVVVPASNAIQTVPVQDAVAEPPMIEKRMTPELLLKLGRLGGVST